MKTVNEIMIAHGYYKKIADATLDFLRSKVLDENTFAKEEISNLNTRFRNKQYALEFVMPELREGIEEKIIKGIINVHNENLNP